MTPFRWKRQLEMLITLPSAIPGTVMAVFWKCASLSCLMAKTFARETLPKIS